VVQAGLEFCKVAGDDGPWLACPAGRSENLAKLGP
jgi:hypothetical protein